MKKRLSILYKNLHNIYKKWRHFKRRHKHVVTNIILTGIAIFLLLSGLFLLWVSTFKIPTLENFEERKVVQSTKIYDKTGETLLFDVFENTKRTVVPFDQISNHVKQATLAIEDNSFYEHIGIKPSSIIRAVLVNLGGLQLSQGGSTITQQVVKNSLLTTEKKISRKIKEWVLALKLERIMTKDEIFALYLNEIPYGGSIYGIEEASKVFFSKKASELTLTESAYLASLPKAPTFYSPYGNNRERLEERKNLVLKEMLRNKFITEDEYTKARSEKIAFRPKEEMGIKAPHFVFYVIEELQKKYGDSVLETGGLSVVTTLDYKLQKKAEELARTFAAQNEKTFNAENLALVAIDPDTGGILTMVGSRDYFDKEIDGNFNITTAHRQPGSAFKPFAYAMAFNKGYTPETVVFDVETEFSTNCSPDKTYPDTDTSCYRPENYDNIFRGPVSFRNALAQSINIPAIKVLYLAGMKDTLSLAKNMGIESLTDINRYGLTLVLGGGEVALLDMTSAYGTFANEGVRAPASGILEVRDRNGNVLEKLEPRLSQVLPTETALKISDVLSDNTARSPAFGERSFLYFPNRDVAVKTGTTNDYRDAWVIGYTPKIAVGAWAGNNNNTPMEKKVAGFIIAPFWNAFMNEALKEIPDEKFKKPIKDDSFDLKPVLRGKWQGGISYQIDTSTGKMATEYTPRETLGEILSGGIHTILYWLNKDDPRGEAPDKPGRDPQFNSWEYSIRRWVSVNGIPEVSGNAPSGSDDVHGPEYAPKVSFVTPEDGKRYNEKEKLEISLSLSSRKPVSKVDYYMNDNFLGTSDRSPFSFSFIPSDIGIEDGKNTIRVVVYDSVFNKTEESIDVRFEGR